MKEEKYDYTISHFVSQNFGVIIGEKMTCLSCHKMKRPKVFKKKKSFIMLLE